MSAMNMKGFFEKYGIKEIDINADQSTEKNLAYKELLENGNDKLLKEEELNPLADIFINSVKANRKGKLKPSAGDPFKGAVYMGAKALEIGLIDHIGPMSLALDRIDALVASHKNGATASQKANSQTNNNMNLGDIKTNISGWWKNVTGKDEKSTPNAEQLDAMGINAKTVADFEALEAQLAQANEATSAADALLATANASVTSLTTERDNWKAKALEFGAKDDTTFTDPKTTGKEDLGEPKKKIYSWEKDAEEAKAIAARRNNNTKTN